MTWLFIGLGYAVLLVLLLRCKKSNGALRAENRGQAETIRQFREMLKRGRPADDDVVDRLRKGGF